MAKLVPVKPEEIPQVRGRKAKPFYHRFHDKIKRLLEEAGFTIERSDYFKEGADIIASAENNRVIVQCRCAKKVNTPYKGLDSLIDEYSTKVRKERARVAILALGNYHVPERYLTTEKRDALLNDDKIVVWNDKLIEYYFKAAKSLKGHAKYAMLADFGVKDEFDKPITVPALNVKQNDCEFFIFKITPDKLLKIAYVFRREYDPRAYQRMLKPGKLEDISEFLKDPKALFPNTVICVFGDGAKFDEKSQMLIIPMKYSSVWIVDGQHRLYGFAHLTTNKLQNFELVCSGFNVERFQKSHLSTSEQGKLFVDINQKATKVPSELLFDLYEMIGITDRRVEIVKKLATTKIFKDKIKFPGKKGEISSVTFITTAPMDRLIRDGGWLSKWYRGPQDKFEDFCLNVLKIYFSIFAEVFSEEWDAPETYVLATDRGIRTLLRLLSPILDYSKGMKKEKIKECLEALKGAELTDAELAKGGGYYGEGGANKLAERWISHIRSTIPTFSPMEKQEVTEELVILPGEKEKAEEFVKRWFSKLEGEVVGELAYIDKTTFEYLKLINPDCKSVRLIVSNIDDKPKCQQLALELQKERPNLHIVQKKIVFEDEEREYEHERWLAGQNYEVDLSTDLKSSAIANKKHTIKILNKVDLSSRYCSFKKEWDTLPKKAGIKITKFFPP